MSTTTPKLGLFKYDTSTDGKEVFSIQTALNNNWDIIDNIDPLPSQTGKSGCILTTDGFDTSWQETSLVYPVIETYSMGQTWYRVYSDGWCEQGGQVITPATGWLDVYFLKEFTSMNYYPFVHAFQAEGSYTNWYAGTSYETTASMRVAGPSQTVYYIGWMACGYIEV